MGRRIRELALLGTSQEASAFGSLLLEEEDSSSSSFASSGQGVALSTSHSKLGSGKVELSNCRGLEYHLMFIARLRLHGLPRAPVASR